ncbi:MAG: hypothetical protein ABSB96_02805 [Gaiellaceae bacterium]
MTVILGHPASVSHSSQATFVFYSNYWDVDSYLCSLDRHAYKTCVPLKTYYGLKNGKHRFAVKAVSNGMAGPAVCFAWVIQIKKKVAPVVAPTVVITSHPSLTTVSTTATFGFSSNKSNATFTCVIDKQASTNDGGYAPCTSPTSYTDLAPGNHVFTVVAVANHLSSSPQTFVWVISAVAPRNTALPTITGTAQAGQTLTTSSGSWTGSLPISYAYQWQLCSSGSLVPARMTIDDTAPITGPVFCGDIVGATSPSYTIQGAGILGSDTLRSFRALQFGIGVYYTLRVVVTATNAAGQAEAASSQTSPVLPAAPVNVILPLISVADDPPVAGDTASTGYGSWLNFPDEYSFQWQRCDASGNNCSDISGPTSSPSPYVLLDSDVGSTLRVTVTATNDGGSTSATSLPTAVIVEAV